MLVPQVASFTYITSKRGNNNMRNILFLLAGVAAGPVATAAVLLRLVHQQPTGAGVVAYCSPGIGVHRGSWGRGNPGCIHGPRGSALHGTDRAHRQAAQHRQPPPPRPLQPRQPKRSRAIHAELEPNRRHEGTPPTAGVLFVHGMSDSPYSLRAVEELFQQEGAATIRLRL